MRGYLKHLPKLSKTLESQKSFEKVLQLITKFSVTNLGNRAKAKKKVI